MSTNQKVYAVGKENKALFEEARNHPVIVEMDGKPYVVNMREMNSSPFTAETARASLPSLEGRGYVSDDELEDIIREANEKHAREIMEQMDDE